VAVLSPGYRWVLFLVVTMAAMGCGLLGMSFTKFEMALKLGGTWVGLAGVSGV